jgi:hypothetical protein
VAELSPAAQAVLNAVHAVYWKHDAECPADAEIIAAALRAAADQTTQPDPLMGIGCVIYSRAIYAIATELENHQ